MRALNSLGEPFGILIDDNDSVIKDTVYAFYNQPRYYPPFVSVTRGYGNGSDVLLASIIDILATIESLSQVYFDPFGMEDMYERFADQFSDLDKEAFVIAVEYTLFYANASGNNFKQLLTDSSEVENTLLNTTPDANILKKQKVLRDFFKKVYAKSSFNEIEETLYSVVVFKWNGTRSVKLLNLFNAFTLTSEFPFMAMYTKQTGLVMKVLNELPTRVSENEIKSWVMNENKKTATSNFKRIKGVLFKGFTFDNDTISINIMDTGEVVAKFESTRLLVLDVITQHVITIVGKLFDSITSMDRRILQDTQLRDYVITSLTSSVRTNRLVDLTVLKRSLENESIREYIPFETKTLTTDNVLSIIYTPGKNKGTTINVRKNMHASNSSFIMIFNALDKSEVDTISKYILFFSDFGSQPPRAQNRFLQMYNTQLSEETEADRVLEKGTVKELRQKTGLAIDSKKCQRDRQPVIVENDSGTLPDVTPPSYILEYKGVKYMCPKAQIPYPGFNVDNTPCCFKKPQKDKVSYTRNVDPQQDDVIVQPSNHKVTVRDPQTNNTFETYLVKRGETYYFLDTQNTLIRAPFTLDVPDDIVWLQEAPLSRLIKKPLANVCQNPPILENKSTESIHKPCEHYPNNKYFGYNAKSYPCCFKTSAALNKKAQSSKSTQNSKSFQYILQRDKLLKPGQIGVLSSNLQEVFKKVDGTRKYYKVGVNTGIQKYASFANAVMYAVGARQSSTEFLDLFIAYIQGNPSVFERLNSGHLGKKYKTIENFKKSYGSLSFTDLHGIAEEMYGVNVIIIDIPYTSSKTVIELDYDNTRVYCGPSWKEIDRSKPAIVLIKRGLVFEVMIELDVTEKDILNVKHTGVPIVDFLYTFYEKSCVRTFVYPENFPYDKPLPEIKEIADPLETQLFNSHNKVEYIVTQSGLVIPVQETSLVNDLPAKFLGEYKPTATLDDYIRLAKRAKTKISVRGVTINTNGEIDAALTNYGQLVPLKASKMSNVRYPVLPYKYYPDVNDYILPNQDVNVIITSIAKNDMATRYITQLRYKSDTTEAVRKAKDLLIKGSNTLYEKRRIKSPLGDGQIDQLAKYYIIGGDLPTSTPASGAPSYAQLNNVFKDHVYRIKKILAGIIQKYPEAKEIVVAAVTSPQISRMFRIQKVIDILKEISKPELDVSDFVLELIANDIVMDTVEQNFVNNTVTPDTLDLSQIVVKEDESVLFNAQDIKQWIQQATKEKMI
ncbi:MAG: hypothetical protein EBU90_10775 [Proteobacteria bacterium]|nr:hypothetical protein [Pseudomonadota bacterium]